VEIDPGTKKVLGSERGSEFKKKCKRGRGANIKGRTERGRLQEAMGLLTDSGKEGVQRGERGNYIRSAINTQKDRHWGLMEQKKQKGGERPNTGNWIIEIIPKENIKIKRTVQKEGRLLFAKKKGGTMRDGAKLSRDAVPDFSSKVVEMKFLSKRHIQVLRARKKMGVRWNCECCGRGGTEIKALSRGEFRTVKTRLSLEIEGRGGGRKRMTKNVFILKRGGKRGDFRSQTEGVKDHEGEVLALGGRKESGEKQKSG